ncbi:hypothetical protein BDY21DRAFT_23202 [Lineolata rhizophorae]|uniref:Uncharacterized protein n=1 Tax=Lineolata rhizophorae TaxID=578093 RepID=A0A6A6P035_9PEZI|nr:hypothetical protein BDY21DRAFT_23202 [Lineolata rhizophorae]
MHPHQPVVPGVTPVVYSDAQCTEPDIKPSSTYIYTPGVGGVSQNKHDSSTSTPSADACNGQRPLSCGDATTPPFGSRSGQKDVARDFLSRLKFSHGWFILFNIATVALAICVTSGCRTNAEAKYGMVEIDGHLLAAIATRNCDSCNRDDVPDTYQLGVSGICRTTDGETACEAKFPYSFNMAALILSDIPDLGLNDDDIAFAAEVYEDYVDDEWVNHELVGRLAIARGALLIVSIFIGFVTMGASLTQSSGWSTPIFLPLIIDTLVLYACAILSALIFAYELAPFSPSYAAATANSSGQLIIDIVDVGTWLLVAAIVCRLISNPVLFLGFLLVHAVAIVMPLFIVLFCFSGLVRSGSSTTHSSNPAVPPKRPAGVTEVCASETEVEERKDGTTTFTRISSAYVRVTRL